MIKRDDITVLGATVLLIFYFCAFAWILGQAPLVILAIGVSPQLESAAVPIVLGIILILAALAWGIGRALKALVLPQWALLAFRIVSWFVLADGFATLLLGITGILPATNPGARLALFLYALYLMRIAVEWLFRFYPEWTRRYITDVLPRPQVPPLSRGVRIAGWLFIADGCLCLLLAFLRWPAAFAGDFTIGWSAAALYVVYCVAELALGVGVLRHSELARKVAIGYLALGIFNVLVYVLIPLRENRLIEFLATVAPGLAGAPLEYTLKIFWVLMTIALFSRAALIWPLLSVSHLPMARPLRRPTTTADG